jgi:hypothetical protein
MPEFNLPESVRAYLEDDGVAVAVDALLGTKPSRLPADLKLGELPEYVAARAQAELTRWEFAQACLNLWSSVWEPLLVDWQPGKLSDLVDDEDSAVTPEDIWTSGGFSLWYQRDNLYLWTAVELTPAATTIAFALDEGDTSLLKDAPHFEWVQDGDWTNWLIHRQARVPAGFGSEVEQLKSYARAQKRPQLIHRAASETKAMETHMHGAGRPSACQQQGRSPLHGLALLSAQGRKCRCAVKCFG